MSILIRSNKVITAGGKVLARPEPSLYLSATRMPQYADGTAVPSFLDYSGNNYNATQATTSLQPLFKTNQFGVNAGIKFDGVDDILNLSGGALDIFKNINQFTVQCVVKRSVISTNAPVLQFTTGASPGASRFIIQFSSTSLQCAVRMLDSTLTAISIFTPTNDLNSHLIQCTAISNVLYVYFDGVLTGTTTMDSATSSNTSSTNGYIGSIPSNFGSAIINAISINQLFSSNTTLQAQYIGYLQRGYL